MPRAAQSHNIGNGPFRFGSAYNRGASYENGVSFTPTTKVDLGTPATAAANNIATSQAVTVGTTPLAVLNGTLVSNGVAVLDVARNVVAAWTGTAVLTVRGTDVNGDAVTESSASGTSFTGKKAFKRVTSVTLSANVTALTVGTGVLLGMPIRINDGSDIIAKYTDGVVDTGGTVAYADTNTATATTGDTRGTISFTSAPNGSRRYKLWIGADGTSKSAAYGVPQFSA